MTNNFSQLLQTPKYRYTRQCGAQKAGQILNSFKNTTIIPCYCLTKESNEKEKILKEARGIKPFYLQRNNDIKHIGMLSRAMQLRRK